MGEGEIKELMEVLNSQKEVGVEGPLIDTEGYPRSDIDVYTVRHARHQIVCLQNDHKAVMKEIEEGLYEVHAEARKKKGEGDTDMGNVISSVSDIELSAPFLNVDRVDMGSPSEEAGLKVGDQVVRFGSVTKGNFQNLKDIGSLVQHSKDKSVSVSVLRGDKEHRLCLIPHSWSGKGLLGCNIVPLK